MLMTVETADLPQIRVLIRRTLRQSVTLDPRELREIEQGVAANLAWWCAHPHDALHLKYVADNGQLQGVPLVKHYWNMCHLFVAPPCHGRGIGRQLTEAALAACACTSPKGSVLVNSSRDAVGFYRRLGFCEQQMLAPLPGGATRMVFDFS